MPLAAAPTRLPGPLAEPLHFPGHDGPGLWSWLALALLALGAIWLWRRWRRRSRPPAAAATPERSLPAAEPSAFERSLRRLEHVTLTTGLYRRGCHELATLVRSHFEQTGLASGQRLPLTRLTAQEIHARAGDGALSRLLIDLAGLRFGRRDPDHKDFRNACDLARRLAGGRRG